MCGIAGILNLDNATPITQETLRSMILSLRHRGPDDVGIYQDASVGLASARLSIVDLTGGQQPIGNEDDTLWIVFNGEIFNYVELRQDLEARGHCFATNCDTEVILHLYEEHGPDCLNHLNGQFALAVWDVQKQSLFLARDRLGVRPLYYTQQAGQLVFGSEIKAILAGPAMRAEIDAEALRQVFTYWSPLAPRTMFRDVVELPPGHYLMANGGDVSVKPYWRLDFTEYMDPRPEAEYLDEFESLLVDATRIRLRADVAVGAYLSGGLDSSLISAMIRKYTNNDLDTFSIAFSSEDFDESAYQWQMARFLGTHHQEIRCTDADIGRVFPDVIQHTEAPVLRTAPAPMFLLSGLVHQNHYKVVLTGEGADELLAGYDLFKEMQIRRFWARRPESQLRPMLLGRLYPDNLGLSQSAAFRTAFFRIGLENTLSPFYSHQIRWANTARNWRFLANHDTATAAYAGEQGYPLRLPAEFRRWSPLAQAQYLEITTFLSPYLLASQGDRVSMAHSVEGRYPFLDYRVVEFCNRLPANLKLRGLHDKWLLRQLGRRLLPAEIWRRAKRPYRAPIQRSFFAPDSNLEYPRELLSASAIRQTGYFNPGAVEKLANKAGSDAHLSEIEEMALVGILSTQLLDQHFVRSERLQASEPISAKFKLVDQASLASVA